MKEYGKETDKEKSQEATTQGTNIQRSMQGLEGQEQTTPRPDRELVDASGRNITLRTYDNGASQYIRASDNAVQKPPERAGTGQAGYANVLLEARDGRQRARLQDIGVPPAYQESGIGSELLKEAETLAEEKKCVEIYGLAPDDQKTLNWYKKRGYGVRARDGGGTEVFKAIAQ